MLMERGGEMWRREEVELNECILEKELRGIHQESVEYGESVQGYTCLDLH